MSARPKLKPGKARPIVQGATKWPPGGPAPIVPQIAVSQKRLNELVADFELLCNALAPFARYAEILPLIIPGTPRATDEGPAWTASRAMEDRVVTFRDLRDAKRVLDAVYAHIEDRRVADAERAACGNGNMCKLCGNVIEGSDDFELLGYCSKTCQREDTKSEWPAPDPGKEPPPPNPDQLAVMVAKGQVTMDQAFAMFGLGPKTQKP